MTQTLTRRTTMRLYLFGLLSLSSCSLLFPTLLPERCEEGEPSSCAGSILRSCEEGFESEQDCAPGVCDPVQLRCDTCGDGQVGSTEECDDGGSADGDGCSADCRLEGVCGNNLVEAGEQCDDGNITEGDGCDASCQIEVVCGDNVVEGSEECDDGNTDPGDGCDPSCQLETICGNGLIEGVEQCDNGAQNSDATPDACRTNCRLASCGDNVVDTAEECDDGNQNDGDGCSSICVEEVVGCNPSQAAQAANVGDTTGAGSAFSGSCTGTNFPERLFTFTPPGGPNELGTLSLVLLSDSDQGVYVRTDCNDTATELGCIDNEFGGTPEFLDIPNVQGGVPLTIFVDVFRDVFGGGFPDGEPGPFALFVTYSTCGDGVINTGEVCDDGDTFSGDGCRGDCFSDETCGNGVLDADEGEECDDGNQNNADGCNTSCVANPATLCAAAIQAQGVNIGDTTFATAGIFGPCFDADGAESIFTFTPPGDGNLSLLLHSLDEMEIYLRTDCDDASTEFECVDNEDGNATERLTTFVDGGIPLFIIVDGHFGEASPFALELSFDICGNGVVSGVEACDDGNQIDGDGCSANCLSDETCGNGFIDSGLGEECDDGNTTNLDGCEGNCTFICGASAGPDAALLDPSNNHCFIGFDDFQTWNSAQAICASVGGSLAVVNSAAENDLLAPFVAFDFWIGLNDQATEGTFVWVNGEAVAFTDFAAGEGTSGAQDCVTIQSNGWHDEGCNNFFRYACELP